jgi:hypothetical protein
MHVHGFYWRYVKPTGKERLAVLRYRCPDCGLTVSVLPADRLPYRSLEGARLEAFLDAQAGIRSGPDPPPGVLEAGCLRRAWTRFQTRVSPLKEAFGLLIPSVLSGAEHLWQQMRLAKKTLAGILGYLGQSCNRSLLGDYRCLRLPS